MVKINFWDEKDKLCELRVEGTKTALALHSFSILLDHPVYCDCSKLILVMYLLSPETKAKERGGKERGGKRERVVCVW